MNHHLTRKQLSDFIQNRDFSGLFVELGWDRENLDAASLQLTLDEGRELSIELAAEKRGFAVCVCDAGEDYPEQQSDRRRLVNLLSRHHYEHLLIIHGKARQCWTVAIRPQNRPMRTVEVEWNESQSIQPLMEKLDGMIFDISEEDSLGITDVVDRVRDAFIQNAERVTRAFYCKFKDELSDFSRFIEGIREQVSKEWYAALMLNRLMFIYFIQKKRFLNGDINYLETRLEQTKQEYGANTFHDHFYRHFLRQLFSKGLGAPESERTPELQTLLGRIPYLNGGLFDLHEIERDNEDIQIPDKAFEKLFDFFGQYDWHLDSRPSASGNDINPDVIGYIFEKYINDRAAMGAYYTQEDITGYISRNTIIPFLLRRAKDKCQNAFDSKNGIWRFLRENPDDYIYDVVKKGCDIADDGIPENIRRGIDTEAPNLIERRKDWNTPTEERFALPTEIWRETMARRKRFFELKERLQRGEICEIDDLITYNLDIERFTSDALRHYEGSDFIAAFYEAIAGRTPLHSHLQGKRGVTVLDPACGSGAFLFAALNILEPLYERCVERMHDFVDNDDKARQQGTQKGTKKHPQFRAVLGDIETHQNQKYWIYKTIILNNLYGVDLMKEATEITKLRLFLKLAAEAEYDENKNSLGLEPLPDIDFNIRSGNSLVGFANMATFKEAVIANIAGQRLIDFSDGLIDEVKEQAELVQKANNAFKQAQDVGGKEYQQAKTDLSARLATLNDKMNRYLAKQYGGNNEGKDYERWLSAHQPFHWLAEFYGIIEENGGFDVVIGNPPYLKITKLKYTPLMDTSNSKCPDIYGYFLTRSHMITPKERSHIGFIVMHNLAFHKKFQEIRDFINTGARRGWFSFYGRIPSGLFSGNVRVRNCIFISDRSRDPGIFYTTRLHRWQADHRDLLFPKIEYTKFDFTNVIPMFNDQEEAQFFQDNQCESLVKYTIKQSDYPLYFKLTAYNWISVSLNPPPCFDSSGKPIPQTKISKIFPKDLKIMKIFFLLLTGRMFFSYWLIHGDEFDVTSDNLLSFRFPIEKVSKKDMNYLLNLADELAGNFENVVKFKLNAGKKVGSYDTAKLWHITDKSDLIFLKYITSRREQVFESIVRHVSQTITTTKRQ